MLLIAHLLAAVEPAGDSSASFSLPPWLTPVISTGVVGIFLLMIIFRVKIMPTWIYDEAKKDWETQHQADTARINELMAAQKTSTELYIEKIMPTMVSALDINREYLDMRRTDAAERQAFQRTEMDRMRNRREGDSHDG